MTKEQILEKNFGPKFNELFGVWAKDQWLHSAMEEYSNQEVDKALHTERNKLQARFSEISLQVAAEREKAAKLVEALHIIYALESKDTINEIIKQSITEYKKQ